MNVRHRSIWNYIVIAWIFIWFGATTALIIIYGIERVAATGLLLVPFILCGFIIPLLIFYSRSTLTPHYLKNRLLALIPSFLPGRPKHIHYFCLFAIPLTCIFIGFLILAPDSFLQYGCLLAQKYREITSTAS